VTGVLVYCSIGKEVVVAAGGRVKKEIGMRITSLIRLHFRTISSSDHFL
jgi:hypothetical protein